MQKVEIPGSRRRRKEDECLEIPITQNHMTQWYRKEAAESAYAVGPLAYLEAGMQGSREVGNVTHAARECHSCGTGTPEYMLRR